MSLSHSVMKSVWYTIVPLAVRGKNREEKYALTVTYVLFVPQINIQRWRVRKSLQTKFLSVSLIILVSATSTAHTSFSHTGKPLQLTLEYISRRLWVCLETPHCWQENVLHTDITHSVSLSNESQRLSTADILHTNGIAALFKTYPNHVSLTLLKLSRLLPFIAHGFLGATSTSMLLENLIIFRKPSLATRNSTLPLFTNLSGNIDGPTKLSSYARFISYNRRLACRDLQRDIAQYKAVHQECFPIWVHISFLHRSLINVKLAKYIPTTRPLDRGPRRGPMRRKARSREAGKI